MKFKKKKKKCSTQIIVQVNNLKSVKACFLGEFQVSLYRNIRKKRKSFAVLFWGPVRQRLRECAEANHWRERGKKERKSLKNKKGRKISLSSISDSVPDASVCSK